MLRAGGDHHHILDDGMRDEGRIVLGHEADQEVDGAFAQPLAQRHAGRDGDVDARVAGLGQQQVAHLGQHMVGRNGPAADAHMARVALGEIAHFAQRLLGGAAQQPGTRQQHLAHRRELDAPALALEQRAAEGLLEPLHRLGQRGLRAPELVGGLAQVAGVGDHLEIFQVAQLDVHS
ncbi:hypothetical protein D9M72_265550 [compost metagenome]